MLEKIKCKKLLKEIELSDVFNISLFEEHIITCNVCDSSYIQDLIRGSREIKSVNQVKTSENFMTELDNKINLINLNLNNLYKESLFHKFIFTIQDIFNIKKQYLAPALSLIIVLVVFTSLQQIINQNNQQTNKNIKITKNTLLEYNEITKYMLEMNINNENSIDLNKLNNDKAKWLLYNDNL